MLPLLCLLQFSAAVNFAQADTSPGEYRASLIAISSRSHFEPFTTRLVLTRVVPPENQADIQAVVDTPRTRAIRCIWRAVRGRWWSWSPPPMSCMGLGIR